MDESSKTHTKAQLAIYNNYNKHLMADIVQLSNRLFHMDKLTRQLFTDAIKAARKQIKFNDDQIMLLPSNADPEKRKISAKRNNGQQSRLKKLVSAANRAGLDKDCRLCGDTGWIDSKVKMCSCPAKAIWAKEERKRLGIIL